MSWWRKIPVALVDAHRVMLSRLRAQESIRAINVGALSSGHVEEADYKKAMRRLQRESEGAPTTPKRAKQKFSPAALEAMGISVVFEPPSPMVT